MSIFNDISGKISSVLDSMDEILVQGMVENSAEIIDMNVSQLEEGIGSDGAQVGEYASDEYSKLKQSMGSKAPLGIVDTKLTGSFHEGFYTETYIGSNLGSSGLFINSRDNKTESLEGKYSNLFGISPDNTDEVQNLLTDGILNNLQNEITNIR